MMPTAVVRFLLLTAAISGTLGSLNLRVTLQSSSIIRDVTTDLKEAVAVPTGSNVTLECRGDGVKSPLYFLYKGTPTRANKLSSMMPLKYTISNVTYWSDSGAVYGCADFSGRGVDLTLVVLIPPIIEHGPEPYVKSRLQGNKTLRCSAYGNPDPYIEFEREGQTVRSKVFATFKNSTVAGKQIRIIENTFDVAINSTADYGNYTCVVSNSQGNVTRVSFVAPQESPQILSITRLPVPVKVGSRISLSCAASGVPVPTIVWLLPNGSSRSSRNVTERGRNVSSQLVLKSAHYEDAGRYECVAATGKLFKDRAQTIVSVTGIPQPPTNISIVNITSTSSVLTFVLGFDGMSSILYSIAELNDHRSSIIRVIRASNTNNTVALNRLMAYSSYSVRIYSRNGNGESAKSLAVNFTTDIAVPAEVPSGLTVSVLNSTSVHVQWHDIQKSSWNSPTRGFVVQYDSQYSWINQTNRAAVNFSVIISDLAPYTYYNFSVGAFNSKGRGNFSDEVGVRSSEAVPSSPPTGLWVNRKTSRWAVIQFEAPPLWSINGILQGFITIVREVKRDVIVYNNTVNKTKLTADIIELEPFTNYSIQVAAYTQPGHGPWSIPIFLLTDEEESGPPTWVQAYADTDAFTLQWQAPTLPNGRITKYLISYQKEGDTMNSSMFVNSVSAGVIQQTTIRGNLSSGTNYTFTVYAINGKGLGKPSRNLRVMVTSIMSRASTDAATTNVPLTSSSSGGPSQVITQAMPSSSSRGIDVTETVPLSSSGGDYVIIIVCATVGALVLVLLIVLLFWWLMRKRRKQEGITFNDSVIKNKGAIGDNQQGRYSRCLPMVAMVNVPDVVRNKESLVIVNSGSRDSKIEPTRDLEEETAFHESVASEPVPSIPERKPSKTEVEAALLTSRKRASSPDSSSNATADDSEYSQPTNTVPRGKKTSRKVKHDPGVDNKQMPDPLVFKNFPPSLKKKPFESNYAEPQDSCISRSFGDSQKSADDPGNGNYEEVVLPQKSRPHSQTQLVSNKHAKKLSFVNRWFGKNRSKSDSEMSDSMTNETQCLESGRYRKGMTLPSRPQMDSIDEHHPCEKSERSFSLGQRTANGGSQAHLYEDVSINNRIYQDLQLSKSQELQDKEGHQYARPDSMQQTQGIQSNDQDMSHSDIDELPPCEKSERSFSLGQRTANGGSQALLCEDVSINNRIYQDLQRSRSQELRDKEGHQYARPDSMQQTQGIQSNDQGMSHSDEEGDKSLSCGNYCDPQDAIRKYPTCAYAAVDLNQKHRDRIAKTEKSTQQVMQDTDAFAEESKSSSSESAEEHTNCITNPATSKTEELKQMDDGNDPTAE